MNTKRFTSESVTEGHPDKVCDQIADKILDELLKQDPQSRCACEVIAEPGAVHIMGEITTAAEVDYIACAREVIREIGYTDQELGFTDQSAITCSLHRQSLDIAIGVDCALENKGTEEKDIGAGRPRHGVQGFACNETENYMPLAIQLANELTRRLTYLRKAHILSYLRPDGKAQVTVEYQDGKPKRVAAVVVSAQHNADVEMTRLRDDIEENLIKAVIPAGFLDKDTQLFINPTGRFVLGGPAADTGLTGRKIIATPTAVMPDTEAALSPAKTPPRLIVLPPTWHDISPSILWQRSLPTNVKFRSGMPSVWHGRFPFWWIPLEQAEYPTMNWRPGYAALLTSARLPSLKS